MVGMHQAKMLRFDIISYIRATLFCCLLSFNDFMLFSSFIHQLYIICILCIKYRETFIS